MNADVIGDLKIYSPIYVSEMKYQKYQQNILKEIAVLESENAKIFQARSHIHRFFSILVFCHYTVVYNSAIP